MVMLKRHTLVGIATLVTLVVLDAIWLSTVAVHLYRATVPDLLRPQPDLLAAAAFYVVYAAGLIALCAPPGGQALSLAMAARLGAILGLTAYATFGLTNLAVMQGWTLSLAIIDMIWGTALTSVAAVVACKVGQLLVSASGESPKSPDRQ
jgi:uncharacterized membrane protein